MGKLIQTCQHVEVSRPGHGLLFSYRFLEADLFLHGLLDIKDIPLADCHHCWMLKALAAGSYSAKAWHLDFHQVGSLQLFY